MILNREQELRMTDVLDDAVQAASDIPAAAFTADEVAILKKLAAELIAKHAPKRHVTSWRQEAGSGHLTPVYSE